MLLASTKRLRVGMVTAVPVLHPLRSSTHLVQADVSLTPEMIGRLEELKVAHAWIKHPLLKDLDPLLLTKVPEQRRKIYDALKEGFDDLQHRVITTQDYGYYRNVIAGLIDQLLGRNGKAGDLAERLFNDGNELTSHSANVAFLAVTVGMQLEGYIIRQRGRVRLIDARDLTSLGVGAMLHDIGKLQLPPDVQRQHALTPRPHAAYPDHVPQGFAMLRHRINPVATTVALHHHQRWDGAGWPDMTALTQGRRRGGLSGAQTHIFARIVAAANVFDNLLSPEPGQTRPAVAALKLMQSDRYTGAFDPVVLDAFLRYVPPFPTGTEVVLSTGQAAAVVELNPDAPCRPRVRLLEDDQAGTDIDLAQTPSLHIAQAQGQDVRPWLFDLPPKSQALQAALAESIV